MEVFRISKAEYADKLSSSGSANRWNKNGQNVIYTGSSRSLSTLELVVHRGSIVPKIKYKVMVISISGDSVISEILISNLPKEWRMLSNYPHLQSIGSDWYEKQESLILKVPSAIIPEEYNYIINTEHPDFLKNIKLIRKEDYFWDERLL